MVIDSGFPDIAHRAIFYRTTKFSLLDDGYYYSLGDGRIATWAKFKDISSQIDFYVFNSHWNGFANDENSSVHQTTAQKIANEISQRVNGEYVFVVGDLNTFSYDRPIQYLTSLKDTYSDYSYPNNFIQLADKAYYPQYCSTVECLTNEQSTTYIDYILMSSQLRATGYGRHNTRMPNVSEEFDFASDHDAVMQTIFVSGQGNIIPILQLLLLDE